MSVKYQFIISVFDIIVLYCTYIEDAEDLNRKCFNILSHFTSLQRMSFTEQILKIDNNTSEFCKQILILSCVDSGCENTCIVFIGSTLVQRIKNWSLFRKFVHITYQISGIYPNFRSYVICMPIFNIHVSKLQSKLVISN